MSYIWTWAEVARHCKRSISWAKYQRKHHNLPVFLTYKAGGRFKQVCTTTGLLDGWLNINIYKQLGYSINPGNGDSDEAA